MQIHIHYQRLDHRGLTIYEEDLVADDGERVETYKTLSPEVSRPLSESLRRDGLIAPDQTASAIRKYYFYQEPFDVLVFLDPAGNPLGYYSDTTTWLARHEGQYHLTDLFLDLWLRPTGEVQELDWDEFHHACQTGVLSAEHQTLARNTLQRLVTEAQAGIYPLKYIG